MYSRCVRISPFLRYPPKRTKALIHGWHGSPHNPKLARQKRKQYVEKAHPIFSATSAVGVWSRTSIPDPGARYTDQVMLQCLAWLVALVHRRKGRHVQGKRRQC